MPEHRPAMPRQPFQINHLHAPRRQQGQNGGLGRPGIAIQNHHRGRNRRVIQRLDDQRPPRLVAARNRIDPPANLRQDRRKRPRPLAAPPAIDQGPPAPRLVGQGPLQMQRRVPRHQRRPNLARRKGRDLLVNRPNLRPFRIAQNRQVDRPRNVIFRKLRRGPDVDDIIKAKLVYFSQGRQCDRHAAF